MKKLLQILKILVVILGVVSIVLIIGISYAWVTGSFNVESSNSSGVSPASTIAPGTQGESLGAGPTGLPPGLTPEIKECITQKLGETRANQIFQGSSPTPDDFAKAGSCLN